jgi:hypothetical protein
MSIASWLAGASRRLKQTFQTLIADGKRSEKRAAKLVQLVERAGASDFKPVPGSKGARYFLPGAPKTAPTISRREFIKRKYGAPPDVLATEHKAGTRTYKTAASEEQAAKQIATKARRSQRIARRNRAAEKEGFRQGKKQSRAVREFLERNLEQHDRYLDTGRGRLDSDEYRKTVHLAYEYGFDEDRIERLKMSYTITAQAA